MMMVCFTRKHSSDGIPCFPPGAIQAKNEILRDWLLLWAVYEWCVLPWDASGSSQVMKEYFGCFRITYMSQHVNTDGHAGDFN